MTELKLLEMLESIVSGTGLVLGIVGLVLAALLPIVMCIEEVQWWWYMRV
jgi:hypothetical protein